MGKLIENHPKTLNRWGGEDPLEGLKHRHPEPDFDLEKEREGEGVPLRQAKAVCVNCVFSLDPRPFWKRWFRRLRAPELLCAGKPLPACEHPVTGRVTHINSMFTTPSKGLNHAHERCQDLNLGGECWFFQEEGDQGF